MVRADFSAVVAFPRRPIAVRLRLGQRLMMVLALALTCGFAACIAFLAVTLLPGLIADPGLRRTGIAGTGRIAIDASALKLGLTSNHATIVFVDRAGVAWTVERDLMLFGPLAASAETELWYDAAEPRRVVTAGLLDALGNRWLTFAVLTIGSALTGLLISNEARRHLRDFRRLRRLALDPRPLAVRLGDVRRLVSPEHCDEYAFTFPSD